MILMIIVIFPHRLLMENSNTSSIKPSRFLQKYFLLSSLSTGNCIQILKSLTISILTESLFIQIQVSYLREIKAGNPLKPKHKAFKSYNPDYLHVRSKYLLQEY